jgi:hypothetical protein
MEGNIRESGAETDLISRRRGEQRGAEERED